jgi:hypothetical protein
MRLRILLAALSAAALSGCVTTQSQYADDGYYRTPDSAYGLAYDEGYDDSDYYDSDYYDNGYEDDYGNDDGYYLDPDANYGAYGYSHLYYDNSVYYGDYAYYNVRPIVQISFNIIFGHGGYRHYYRPYHYYGHGYYPYAYWGYWPGYNPHYKPHKPRKPKSDHGSTPAPERPIVDNERPRGQPRAPRPIEPPYRPRPQTGVIGNGGNPEIERPIVRNTPRQALPRQDMPRQDMLRRRFEVPRQPNQHRERAPREFVMLQTPQAAPERTQARQEVPRQSIQNRERTPRPYVALQPVQGQDRTARQAAPPTEARAPRERVERPQRPAKAERTREARANSDSDEP